MQHSDYINGYMAMGGNFLTSSLLNQIPKEQNIPVLHQQQEVLLLAQQFKLARVSYALVAGDHTARSAVNFNANEDITQPQLAMPIASQHQSVGEEIRFWLGFSTACEPFNQFAICKHSTKQWDTSIYTREEAVISANSFSDLCTNNSVSVSPLESIIAGKHHCGVFIDVPMAAIEIAAATTQYYYQIPQDIVFSGVLDLNQLNPIFNSFPVQTRNYASLYLQLWMQDFLQDLKVVWLNKTDIVANRHLAYQMIPPEKPDMIYLLKSAAANIYSYGKFSARIVNMKGEAANAKVPQNTISQIKDASFTKLEIQNPQYPTWFFPVLFHNFDLVIDQRHVIPQPYEALTQSVNGQITRSYPDPVQVGLTLITHYLCDAMVRIMFDDNPDPQVLSLEVIGEMRAQ
ncbi:MAG: hypothetical protein EZS28_006200 [Streblomastix strix]|uniref:Uncharacterized protein n=1 Tax=Streblomastix strix TaxID=222440 RepID=A0A5J4WVM8_9EUKA|nr:MAG: hypothetical protein EZS28_006200 [Streblomastix strix]